MPGGCPSTSVAEIAKATGQQAQENDEYYSRSASLFDWPDHGFITPFLQSCLNLVHLNRAQTFIAAKTMAGVGEQAKTNTSKSKRKSQHSRRFAAEQTDED